MLDVNKSTLMCFCSIFLNNDFYDDFKSCNAKRSSEKGNKTLWVEEATLQSLHLYIMSLHLLFFCFFLSTVSGQMFSGSPKTKEPSSSFAALRLDT